MLYCPHCGTKVMEDEKFCLKCGKTIPDLRSRLPIQEYKKWWVLPVATFALIALTIGLFTYHLSYKNTEAMELYSQAESLLMDEAYEEANQVLQEALDYRNDFEQAKVALAYTNEAIEIEEKLRQSDELMEAEEYKSSLDLLHQSEDRLNTYQGSIVSKLVERIDASQTTIKLKELQAKVADDPTMEEIRILIWEADEINHPEAGEIAAQLRSQLIEYTFSRASEALNEKQFNDALLITEDGLKYAPESEKLQSLQTNIQTEKLSFEAAQKERMEQAMDTALKEHEINENDAIELVSLEVDNDAEGRIVVKGEVKSIATVPIHSILVEYTLLMAGNEQLTNEIYVYPDTLYPKEHGRFEFTHFDLEAGHTNFEPEVTKITWYTN